MHKSLAHFQEVENKVIELRSKKILLDADVAILYGVETKRINEAVKNNPDKFPKGYIFELTKKEKVKVVENFDHLKYLKYSPKLPKAFTEKGLYMLATILKSEKATQTTLAIIETFTKIRELSRTINSLSELNDESQQKTLMQRSGKLITEILGEEQKITGTETTLELNFAVIKLKHTVKRKNEDD